MASDGVGRISMACQCTSMRPGINVRPPPSMICVLALRSVGMGAVEMRSILLPRTSTLLGPESVPDFPSKTRTFWKSTIVGCTSWAIKRNEIKTVTTTRVAPSCLHFGRIGFPPLFVTTTRPADSEQDLAADCRPIPDVSPLSRFVNWPKRNNCKRCIGALRTVSITRVEKHETNGRSMFGEKSPLHSFRVTTPSSNYCKLCDLLFRQKCALRFSSASTSHKSHRQITTVMLCPA